MLRISRRNTDIASGERDRITLEDCHHIHIARNEGVSNPKLSIRQIEFFYP
jgi:hypothetical protein